jgi:hypothetical protein
MSIMARLINIPGVSVDEINIGPIHFANTVNGLEMRVPSPQHVEPEASNIVHESDSGPIVELERTDIIVIQCEEVRHARYSGYLNNLE